MWISVDVYMNFTLHYIYQIVPATRLRLKADTQAEAGGGRVAGGGAELAPDARLQLPFVCHGYRPICQQHLSGSPASTTVDVLGPALRAHGPMRRLGLGLGLGRGCGGWCSGLGLG